MQMKNISLYRITRVYNETSKAFPDLTFIEQNAE